MTAKEKFEARLKELGLWDEWQMGAERVGIVCLDGTIIILSHYCDDDPYTEDEFPPFSELRKNENFRKECWNDFSCHTDSKFVADLARWLSGKTEICPLYPVDVYLPANGLEISSEEFKDDEDDDEDQTMVAENRGEIDLILTQLSLFRSELIDMIRVERRRGHNIPMHFDPYPGWGSLSFYGYNVGGKTFGIDILGDGSPAIVLYEPGEDNITINLLAPDFPIEVLFNIYNEMK